MNHFKKHLSTNFNDFLAANYFLSFPLHVTCVNFSVSNLKMYKAECCISSLLSFIVSPILVKQMTLLTYQKDSYQNFHIRFLTIEIMNESYAL